RAVRSEESVEAPSGDSQVDRIHRAKVAERPGEAARFHCQFHGLDSIRSRERPAGPPRWSSFLRAVTSIAASCHTMGKMNRLSGERSAYLLQHAANPVDWYPWGD